MDHPRRLFLLFWAGLSLPLTSAASAQEMNCGTLSGRHADLCFTTENAILDYRKAVETLAKDQEAQKQLPPDGPEALAIAQRVSDDAAAIAAAKEAAALARSNAINESDADMTQTLGVGADEDFRAALTVAEMAQTALDDKAAKILSQSDKGKAEFAKPSTDHGGATDTPAPGHVALPNAADPAFVPKLDEVVKKDPNNPAALSMRAQVRLAHGDSAGALADARRAAELNPNDRAAQALVAQLEGLGQAQGKINGMKLDFGQERAPLAGLPGAAGRTAVALPVKGGIVVPGAAMTIPAPGVVPPTLRSLFQQAQDKLAKGDDDGALLALREAVDLDPNRPEGWETMSEILNKEGDFAGAIAAAEKALAINPDDARALRAKSYAEFNLGNYQQAFADANRAVALDASNGLGYLYRAMAEEKLGMKEQALKDYRLAEKMDPSLMPAAEEGIRRLGGSSAPDGSSGFPSALVKRVGVVGGSGVLLLLGLLGTASGRRAVQDYTRRMKTVIGGAPREPQAPVVLAEAATVALGALIGGHYRVTGELGRGGMGAVYKANDEKLQRPVAIKQLLRDARVDPDNLSRLLKEARLVAQLQHQNIAEIYSVITDRDPMLVFEYVDGESLDRTLHRSMKLPPERTRRIIAEVCAALDYAHARGIIHRDLKPSNVMIGQDGSAKVMDFGIAHQSSSGATMTRTSTAAGTPPYMAPEQGLGSVSKASDLYSLGVVAYELLTGARPFDGPDYLEPKLRKEFAPVTSRDAALPKALDKFFDKALDPDPTKRFSGAPAFSKAFASALEGVTSPS